MVPASLLAGCAAMEKVTIRIDNDDPSPGELKGYFAEVFASLDAEPRELLVKVYTANDRNAQVSVSIVKGEPVFEIEGRSPARANYRGRWLAEHPSPLVFSPLGTKLVLSPTTGNRVIVRRPTLLERLFG